MLTIYTGPTVTRCTPADKHLRARVDLLREKVDMSWSDFTLLCERVNERSMRDPSEMTATETERVMEYLNRNFEKLGKEGRKKRWNS
jgi:hypothetical protein